MASITKEKCSRSARSEGSSTSTPAWSSALTGALCELYHLELRIFGKNKPSFLLKNCYFNKTLLASIVIPFHHVIWSLGYVKYTRSVGNKIGVLILIITAFYTLNLKILCIFTTPRAISANWQEEKPPHFSLQTLTRLACGLIKSFNDNQNQAQCSGYITHPYRHLIRSNNRCDSF